MFAGIQAGLASCARGQASPCAKQVSAQTNRAARVAKQVPAQTTRAVRAGRQVPVLQAPEQSFELCLSGVAAMISKIVKISRAQKGAQELARHQFLMGAGGGNTNWRDM